MTNHNPIMIFIEQECIENILTASGGCRSKKRETVKRRLSMAEIKSTLDLIMERTKHLTMTDEEKKALHSQELKGKVKGWVQKCVDGNLDMTRLQAEIEKEETKEPELRSDLFYEVLGRIDPDKENEILFQILESVLHYDTAPLRKTIGRFQEELAEKVEEKTVRVKSNLAQRKISGSAVIPNLERDPQWKKDREQLKGFYIKRIRSAAALKD